MMLRPNPAEFKYAAIEATTEGGENTLIAAPGEKKRIVVIGYALSSTAEGALTVKGSATKAKIQVGKSGTASYAGSLESPAFACSANAALILETPAATKAFGHITYILEDTTI